mmetsp:Transcript_1830/g.3985  ORF Transcript_1830/g.3985 Transcript_1830/m.3985 type:complete len:332 (+) Transcript_1830:347-1342(+)
MAHIDSLPPAHLHLRERAVVPRVCEDSQVEELEGLGVIVGTVDQHLTQGAPPPQPLRDRVCPEIHIVVQQPAQKRTLLTGHLCGGGQGCFVHECAVSDGEDVVSAFDPEPWVDHQPPPRLGLRRLLLGKLVNRAQHQRKGTVACCPHDQAVCDSVPIGEDHLCVGDLFDARLKLDLCQRIGRGVQQTSRHKTIRTTQQTLCSLLPERLVEGHEDRIGGLNQLDTDVLQQMRIVPRHVLFDEVEQLRHELHAGGAGPHDHKGEDGLPLRIAQTRDVGTLKHVPYRTTQLLGVANLFEELAVLLHTGNVISGGLCADPDEQAVVWHLELLDGA